MAARESKNSSRHDRTITNAIVNDKLYIPHRVIESSSRVDDWSDIDEVGVSVPVAIGDPNCSQNDAFFDEMAKAT